MTPNEMAVYLHKRFYQSSRLTIAGTDTIFWKSAIRLAEICVEEILRYQSVVLSEFPTDGHDPSFWKDVLQEVKKLK